MQCIANASSDHNAPNMEITTKIVQTYRLQSICGYAERTNDIIYCPPRSEPEPEPEVTTTSISIVPNVVKTETTVVYFGGDVQDYTENMKNQRDGKKYICWNLEETTLLLHRKFPTSHIVVIKPSRMRFLTFSCFKNFVQCNDFGIPDQCPNYYAIDHLEKLLNNVTKRLSAGVDEKSVETSRGQPEMGASNDLILIGFSKGCVVLNQLVHEFHDHKQNADVQIGRQCLIERIREIYWLDGGHSGGRNTWITSKPILETLAQLRTIKAVHVHVTPYQVEDERRPWIRREERIFSDTLVHLGGVTLHRVLHFNSARNGGNTDIEPDISMHFNVLTVFKPDVPT